MPVITFQCYACNQVLQVGADSAGRKAKCSQCGTALTVPAFHADVAPFAAPPPAAPPLVANQPPPLPQVQRTFAEEIGDSEGPPPRGRADAYDEPPRRRRRIDNDYDDDIRQPAASRWDKVKLGFLLAFIGLCVMAGSFGLDVLGRFISLVGFSTGAFGAMRIGNAFHQIATVVSFMGLICAVVGHSFWLFVSNRGGAQGFAIAALSVAGVYLIFQLVGRVLPAFSPMNSNHVLGLFTGLLSGAYFMMIGFYLRGVAVQFDRPDLQGGNMLVVILSGCLAGYELLSGVVSMALSGGGLAVAWIFFLLGSGLTAVVFVFTLLAVYKLKKTVDAASS